MVSDSQCRIKRLYCETSALNAITTTATEWHDARLEHGRPEYDPMAGHTCDLALNFLLKKSKFEPQSCYGGAVIN